MNRHLPYKTFKQISTLFLLVILVQFAEAQCYDFTCFENKELPMNADCIGTSNVAHLLVNPQACTWGQKKLTFFSPAGEEIGDSLGIEYLDMTLVYKLENLWSGDECFGTVTVKDRRGPDIECENISLKCTENYDAASLAAPVAFDNCSYVTSLTHSDEVIDFGCGEQGFTGYFAPENWEECILGSDGDGGFDVSDAPESISVEGADNSPISDNCPYVSKYKIELPTDGYISFDWSTEGGSPFDHENAFITIGDTCVQLTYPDVTEGSFTSWLIPAGMWISFEVTSNGNADNMTATFENFQFITPAIKVIHRTWTGYDVEGNDGTCTQVITLERATLAEVNFPENLNGIDAPVIECSGMNDPVFTEPDATGYPFLDADGYLNTTADQTFFTGGNECLIDVFYNDVTIPDCDGNYTVARTWTVYDNCTGNSIEQLQVIRVTDTTAPDLTCPQDVTVSTDFTSCSATFSLPAFTATDACSENLTYGSAWNFGSNQSVYEVSPGAHTLTLSATDGCDNTAECTLTVTVEDQVAPTVVCDAITAAAVTSAGTSIVFAESIDDGSYDECCAAANLDFEVKLAGAPDTDYAPTIEFDCGYVGGEAQVNMRVSDCNGNSNFCTVAVTIQDNDAPAVLCPENVTVDCGTDTSDLSAFGTAQGADNCAFVISEFVQENINDCGVGSIVRVYEITDPAGNTSDCTQTITLENLTPWNADGNAINFPQDYTVESTCDEDLSPENLPEAFGFPTYNNVGSCEQPAVNFEDEIFYQEGASCYYILRTWSIMDWCGDGTFFTDIQTITVNDTTAPTIENAQSDLTITLDGSNNCTANVTLFTPAVTDCNEAVEITVSGDLGTVFGEYNDISAGVYEVIYTATDGCGNIAEHSFTITVIDDTVPTLNCPADITVDCNTDLTDLTIFGMPTVTESCDADTYTVTENATETLNGCGQGFVERIWTITDENNNTSLCSQMIFIENLTPWNANGDAITFPADYMLTGDCGMGTQPEDLPGGSDFPTWTGEDECAQITATFEDETMMIAAPNCFQINRTWTVSDVCNPGANFTQVQTITVEDNEAPVFIDAPADQTLMPNNPGDCTVAVTIALPELNECDTQAEVILTGDLTEGFGDYDLMPGVYAIVYTATDGCGNTATHGYQITVVDETAPNAVCLTGLTLTIPASQELLTEAASFNAASSDNCTAFPDLIFSFSDEVSDQTLLLNCDEIGNFNIEIYVTDAAGNQSVCTTALQVNDADNFCETAPPTAAPDILGTVYTWESEPVNVAEIALQNTTLASEMTSENGNYAFAEMTYGNNYHVVPQKNTNPGNGVTTIDAYILNDHLDDIQSLDNPYQYIAGDADRNDLLNDNDVTQIEDLILYNEEGFPNNTSWRFTDATYIFPDAANPWAQTFPESKVLMNLTEDTQANFIGIKIGDLNGSANPQNFSGEAEERDGDDLILQTENTTLTAGERYTAIFRATETTDVIAYQFTLDFDPTAVEIETADGLRAHTKFGFAKAAEGALTSLWINKSQTTETGTQDAFTLTFTALANGNLSEFITVNSRFTEALTYRKDLSEAGVQLEFITPEPEEGETPYVVTEYTLDGAAPNPFAEKTTLHFQVPQESEVTFIFYNAAGQKLFEKKEIYAAGLQTFELQRSDLGLQTDAVIFYRMVSGDFAAGRKLVCTERY